MKRRKIFIGGLHKETSFGKPKTFMDFFFFCFLFFVFCFWGKFSIVKSSVLKLVLYLLCLYYQQVYTFLLVLRFKLYQLVDFFSLLKYLNAHITES